VDFSKINIRDILKSAMKNKFQDLPHFDFEDFIGQLFKDNGYEVMKTPRSGDYGADLILTKSGEKIAVQIKRYLPENKVGVQDINQIIGAKDFYKCNKAMIITTSSFSKSGKALATETSTELWDWDKLQRYICDTYLEGKDYYTYYGDLSKSDSPQKTVEFEVTDVAFNVPVEKKIGLVTVFAVKVINRTERNINLMLFPLPTLITVENRQVEASAWDNNYFGHGVIYAGCTVVYMPMFRGDLVPSVHEGDRIIFKWLEADSGQEYTRDYRMSRSFTPTPAKKSSCYVVTICYGTHSTEYKEMMLFRDDTLSKNKMGVLIINLYYRVGGFFARHLQQSEITKRLSRFLIKVILIFVRRLNRRHKRSVK
jgi:hypothetical protein